MQSISLNHTRYEYWMLGKQSTVHNMDNVHNMMDKINKPPLKSHFFFSNNIVDLGKNKNYRSFYVLKQEPVGCLS